MADIKLDKDKYLKILKTQGAQAALTALHQDTGQWEVQSFEGPKGYQPAMWSELEEVRAFSRELWELATREKAAQTAKQNLH